MIKFVWAALALCCVANLVLQAGAGCGSLCDPKDHASFPSNRAEVAQLGKEKEAYKEFCLLARNSIEKKLGRAGGPALNLMAAYYVESAKSFKAERDQVDDLFMGTMSRVVRLGVGRAMYTVCSAEKMKPIEQELEEKLGNFKAAKKLEIPANVAKLSLHDIGCESINRLPQARKGCLWVLWISRERQIPFVANPRATQEEIKGNGGIDELRAYFEEVTEEVTEDD